MKMCFYGKIWDWLSSIGNHVKNQPVAQVCRKSGNLDSRSEMKKCPIPSVLRSTELTPKPGMTGGGGTHPFCCQFRFLYILRHFLGLTYPLPKAHIPFRDSLACSSDFLYGPGVKSFGNFP